MIHPPASARAARMAIAVNAVLWLTFAMGIALGLHPSYRDPESLRWTMAILSAGTAIILIVLARSLASRSRLAFWIAIAFLAALVLAPLFDELGFADLLFITITVLPIVLLLRGRTWYLQPHQPPGQEQAT